MAACISRVEKHNDGQVNTMMNTTQTPAPAALIRSFPAKSGVNVDTEVFAAQGFRSPLRVLSDAIEYPRLLAGLNIAVPSAGAAMEALASIGVTGEAAKAVVARHGASRHQARINATLLVALRWDLLHEGDQDEDGVMTRRAAAWVEKIRDFGRGAAGEEVDTLSLLDAWAVCALDAEGVGGHDGVTGESTLRHPAFRVLGTGRKQAGDGQAWMAALRDAKALLERALEKRGYFAPRFMPYIGGVEGESAMLSIWATPGGRVALEVVNVGYPSEERESDLPWRQAEVKRRLFAACDTALTPRPEGVEETEEGDPAHWAKVYEQLQEEQARYVRGHLLLTDDKAGEWTTTRDMRRKEAMDEEQARAHIPERFKVVGFFEEPHDNLHAAGGPMTRVYF